MSDNSLCEHCNEEIVVSSSLIIDKKEYLFCCQGCRTVFDILHQKNLQNYYQFRKQSEKTVFSPIKITQNKFTYLDEISFLNKYAKKTKQTLTLTFYLEGIHCLACLWLIEKISDFLPFVLQSKLNMSKGTVEVTIEETGKFSMVAKQFELLGYPPHPIMEESEVEKLSKKEDNLQLIKIAIAFFCSGNIMLMSFSIYAGADGRIRDYFDILSAILAVPVLTYCASSFYKNALHSIKNKTLSIDFPIVFAMILGAIFSLYSTYHKGTHIYFDSLSMLVFLLLSSRYLLKRMQKKGLSASNVSSFFSTISAKIIDQGTIKDVHAGFLKVGDIILIDTGDTIAADSVLIEGESATNNSLLTGESAPVKVNVGDVLFSGTINIDSPIKARITHLAQDSKLGSILKTVEKGWNKKTNIIRFTDTISKYFVIIVFSLAFMTFSYFALHGDIESAITRSLTLIIITCPCALGLTTPLSLTLTLAKLARAGIIIKDESVIEKVTQAKNILLDKTGTLTHGKFKVFKRVTLDTLNETDINQIIYTLESKSKHPIAISILSHIHQIYKNQHKTLSALPLSNYQEIPGIGPSANIEGSFFELKSLNVNNTSLTKIGLYRDSQLIEEIHLKDTIKEESPSLIAALKLKGLKPYILSGDSSSTVNAIAKELNIPSSDAIGQMSPTDKEAFVDNCSNSIMVGDGANDAIALSKSLVGVAVHGSVDIALRASSVFMAESSLKNIHLLIQASHETLYLIKRNLIFSLAYNLLGSTLAIVGVITPLVAAVLMPLSSLTVLLSTLYATKELRSINKKL